MDSVSTATRLRVYIAESDWYGDRPLYEAIVRAAREQQLAGATVTRGVLGFGHPSRTRSFHLALSENVPVVVEIIDSEEKVLAFMPTLSRMRGSGLVTIEPIKVIDYGAFGDDESSI